MESITNVIAMLDEVAREKGISKQVLIEALEAAMLNAAKKVFGQEKDLEVQFSEEDGDIAVHEFVTVVEKVENPATEITPEAALELDPDSQVGDTLGIKIIGLRPDEDEADRDYHLLEELGRVAAQSAKQVIMQRVREAERENVFSEYADRKGELVTGVVRRFERGGNIIVDLGRAEAMLPQREQCQRESYRVNDRVQAYVVDVNKLARGAQIILSRTNPGLLIKLFEMEVPEIYEGIVRIEAAAREAGMRSKIAVASSDRDVDPVGACVGMKGSRVQAVVQELRGEKVDIVPFDQDPARFVCNALAPAEVSRVLIDETNHKMDIIVPDDQLSLAIGRRGQNVRLASQLTGWRLDIVSESKVKEMKDRAFKSLGRLKGVNDIHMQTLYNYGIQCAEDVLKAEDKFLSDIPGIGEDAAKRIKADAVRVVEEEQAELRALKRDEEIQARKEAELMFADHRRRMGLKPEYQRLVRVKGVDAGVVAALETAGVHSVEDLQELRELAKASEKAGLSPEKLDQLRHAAAVYLAKEAAGAEVQVSSADAGPEEGYAPSELLNAAPAGAEAGA